MVYEDRAKYFGYICISLFFVTKYSIGGVYEAEFIAEYCDIHIGFLVIDGTNHSIVYVFGENNRFQ